MAAPGPHPAPKGRGGIAAPGAHPPSFQDRGPGTPWLCLPCPPPTPLGPRSAADPSGCGVGKLRQEGAARWVDAGGAGQAFRAQILPAWTRGAGGPCSSPVWGVCVWDARNTLLILQPMAACNLHFIPVSDPLPAPKSQDAAEGEGDCLDPSFFGATMGREPQQNASSSLFPAKALSNMEGGKREGRSLNKIGAEKRLAAGEGAAAGAGRARGTARRVANRTGSLQHGASRWAGGKGNRKGMVG